MRTGNNYSGARFRYSQTQRAPKRKGCLSFLTCREHGSEHYREKANT